jgi:hypothetical protein
MTIYLALLDIFGLVHMMRLFWPEDVTGQDHSQQ